MRSKMTLPKKFQLCGVTPQERRQLPGVSPRRDEVLRISDALVDAGISMLQMHSDDPPGRPIHRVPKTDLCQEGNMPRLPKITDEDASEDLRHIFDVARELLGFISNSTRTVAHSPWVVKWLIPFTAAVQRESGGVLDVRTKELAIIRTSAVNNCDY